MMPPKCYTWLESCGSQLSDGKNEKLFFCILQSVGFSRTLRTDIFLYSEKLSYSLHVKQLQAVTGAASSCCNISKCFVKEGISQSIVAADFLTP